jgi:hypothetical protein
MKMNNAIQTPFFSAGLALPTPPRFEGARRPAAEMAAHTGGYFDIHDAEGYVPEIICRVILGLCAGFTFVVCLIQLAAAS